MSPKRKKEKELNNKRRNQRGVYVITEKAKLTIDVGSY